MVITGRRGVHRDLFALLKASPKRQIRECSCNYPLHRCTFSMVGGSAEAVLGGHVRRTVVRFRPQMVIGYVSFGRSSRTNILGVRVSCAVERAGREAGVICPFCFMRNASLIGFWT